MMYMKMRIHEILCWYQKKIGTYDKQQWEKTIEHRILHGLNHIHPMKTKPPKTEFIDLDLIRGTSFPKAKPKHGFLTVTKLATLRLFLLPLYSKWWAGQTSAKIFGLLLLLYVLQLVNIALYFHTTNKPTDTSINEIVSSSEIIIPILMMFILSIIHSQIVSTHTGPDKVLRKTKTRRTKRLRRRILKRIDQKPLPETNVVVDAQNMFPFETFRKMSSELRHRNNIQWAEQEKLTIVKKERRAKKKNNANLTLNVKFKLNESEKRRHSENDVEMAPVPVAVAADDDGFESFNGCGSSENGEEIVTLLAEVKCENADADGGEVSSTPPKMNDTNNTLNEILHDDLKSKTKLNDNDYSSGAQSDLTESDREGNRRIRSPKMQVSCPDANMSTTEYLGITTNSEDCSYSSEYDESDSQNECNHNDNMWDYDLAPTVILSPSCAPSDRVSCTIWEKRDIKKADLSVLDISSAIIARVETMPETPDYFYAGVVLSILLAFLPPLCRLSESMADADINKAISVIELPSLMVEKLSGSLAAFIDAAFGYTLWERSILSIALIERLSLSCLFFFLLAVAERTFKQRFLYAKLFSHLTSSRRARKSELPHFRLNKVRNIKTWLSVRSYLKRRGPQRSVDVIVSTAFIITLLLLSFISMELLKDSIAVHSQYNFEAVVWCFGLGIFLLRFMTLGTNINRKNRNLSVLITEQINLYLQIEQKPHKKDKLMVANSVLKLAADLLKELESPFKISGLSANPYLYNITKVVILSALSGVLSEMLGFKVKLTKINIK